MILQRCDLLTQSDEWGLTFSRAAICIWQDSLFNVRRGNEIVQQFLQQSLQSGMFIFLDFRFLEGGYVNYFSRCGGRSFRQCSFSARSRASRTRAVVSRGTRDRMSKSSRAIPHYGHAQLIWWLCDAQKSLRIGPVGWPDAA
jgi:hypothetical protein